MADFWQIFGRKMAGFWQNPGREFGKKICYICSMEGCEEQSRRQLGRRYYFCRKIVPLCRSWYRTMRRDCMHKKHFDVILYFINGEKEKIDILANDYSEAVDIVKNEKWIEGNNEFYNVKCVYKFQIKEMGPNGDKQEDKLTEGEISGLVSK